MADDVRVVVVRNEFERLATMLRNEAEQQVAETANDVEAGMRAGTSPRIASTIRTVRQAGGLRAEVTAGDGQKAIHAGFVEFGTVFEAAAPFAVPAADDARPDFMRGMKSLLDRGL